MNKALIAIIVLVVLGVGGWAIYDHNKSSNNSSYGISTTTSSAGNNNRPASNSSQSVASTGSITIKNMMFTPSQISVQKGGTVTWTNDDNTTHIVIDDLSNVGGPSSGTIQPGSTYSFTFNKTGSFQYHCSIHPSMRGTIVVK